MDINKSIDGAAVGLQRIRTGLPRCAWECFIEGVVFINCAIISDGEARRANNATGFSQ